MGIKQTLKNIGNANANKAALDHAVRKNNIKNATLVGGGVLLLSSFMYNRKLKKELAVDSEKYNCLGENLKKVKSKAEETFKKIAKTTDDVKDTTEEVVTDFSEVDSDEVADVVEEVTDGN